LYACNPPRPLLPLRPILGSLYIFGGKAKSTINEHIKNIYPEDELEESLTLKKIGISEFQQKVPNYYNLDVIIFVDYRDRQAKTLKSSTINMLAPS